MSNVHYGICDFCDSACGLEIEMEGDQIIAIRGDHKDRFSRGHICPKGIAHQDLFNDPDRLRRPVRKKGSEWEEVSWEEALEEAGRSLAEVQRKYGRDALALYYGNPIGHNYGSLLCLVPFVKGFRTKNVYSATSVDQLTRMLVSLLVFGNQAVLPIPDIERTDYFLILGANPVVSNGSIMTASDCRNRLIEMRKRGAKIVVVDPRRNETAKIADAHYFIRPGTDALFLLSLLNVMFEEGLSNPGPLEQRINGLDRIKEISKGFPPSRAAKATGLSEADIRAIAVEFASAKKAVCYGRRGTSTQEFGSLATWLIDAVNVATGNVDRPGGVMFTTPAVDLVGLSKILRQPGYFNRWKSRVSGLPEFNGEFPAAVFAEEIETPGPGQIRALVTNAGNPALSLRNTKRIERALKRLEFMVAIDFYINETTRYADLILPPTSPLETDHYPLLEHAMAIRNVAHYAPPVFQKPEGAKHNWEVMLDLLYHVEKHSGALSASVGWIKRKALYGLSPERQLNLLLRLGPHKLSLGKLKREPHGMDLGPLEPRLEKVICTRDGKINLVPPELVKDLDRLEKRIESWSAPPPDEFLLVSRRTLRSNNSWMHNSLRLVKGKPDCSLIISKTDAERLGLEKGRPVRLSTGIGEISVPAEITDDIMPGVVSMPFGWGHDQEGVKLRVAREHPGVNVNEVTDEKLYDEFSGISVLDGIPVKVAGS